MVRCVTCGTVTNDGSHVCSQCGSVLPGQAASAALAGVPPDETRVLTSFGSPSNSVFSSATNLVDEGRFPAGTLIAGRYRIIELLGRGGMGEVYRATDLTLAQSVALKFLPDGAGADIRLLERFHNEVRTARQVSHPAVCRVYDIGQAEGRPFLSMEYVDGEDLASLLQRIGRLPSDKALQIARKMCAGLAAAHDRGIIHRDLKPHNIMLNKRGEPVILDFGLAAIAEQIGGAEGRNGTPAYMSPEQLRGGTVTAKSDIYALGLILYELFTGRRPFEANHIGDVLRAQETTQPPGMTTLAPEIDPAIDSTVLRCLRHDPAERPPSALAVSAALPGGDPLAAALAAGETPSPELVAASGKHEGLHPKIAIPCLLVVLMGAIAFPFLQAPVSRVAAMRMELSPDVLQQKCREISTTLGYGAKPADHTTWVDWHNEPVEWFKKNRQGKSWQELLHAEPPFRFRYRQSPEPLLVFPTQVLSWDRPALNRPGMLNIAVDSRGRLRQFEAVAPRYDHDAHQHPSAPLDHTAALRLAGFDPAKFQEVSPTFTPPLAFDERRAFSGPHPDLPGLKVTVELAAWRGTVTSVHMHWPWIPLDHAQPETNPNTVFVVIIVLGMATLIFFGVTIARSNLRKGRGDRTGAYRVGAFAFLMVISSYVDTHIAPDPGMLGVLFNLLCQGLGFAVLFWILYIALEPLVRSRWPHSLITWNRLLAGQFRDPRLGSHILAGAVLGVVWVYFFYWRTYSIVLTGAPPETTNLDGVIGGLDLLSSQTQLLLNALLSSAVLFFALCGLRALLRRDWLAMGAAALIFTMINYNAWVSQTLWIDLPLFFLIHLCFAFTLLRTGLVPTITAIFVVDTLFRVAPSVEFSSFYTGYSILLVAIPCCLAIYAFRISQTQAEATISHTSLLRTGRATPM